MLKKMINLVFRMHGTVKVEEQEINFLRPLLLSLPSQNKIAFDVGANKGSISSELLGMGYKVYAFEPQPDTAKSIGKSLVNLRKKRLKVIEIAASDHDGEADLLVGSADTLSTLEASWATIAFPEYFTQKKSLRVKVKRLSAFIKENNIGDIGFIKIDAEGHELNVLKGLFDDVTLSKPLVVMFEANKRFPEKALDSLAILRKNDYALFDMFIKEGIKLLTHIRFDGATLPDEWQQYDEYFYANIIAYRSDIINQAPKGKPGKNALL